MGIKIGPTKGTIVAEPETRVISDKLTITRFPFYVNHRVKNRDTGEYETDDSKTTKVTVELKFDLRDEWDGKLHKGDFVEIAGTIVERAYETKDGRTGRALEFDYVESINVINSSAKSDDAEAWS